MSFKDFIDATEREVSEWPGVTFDHAPAGKHELVTVYYRHQSRKVFMARSPSDNARGVQNHIGVVRRELRAMGATRKVQPTSPHKQRENNKPVRSPLQPLEPAPVLPNPFERLGKIKEKIMATVSSITPVQAGTVAWFNDCVERSNQGEFAESVLITPGLATVILSANPDNRNLSDAKVNQYASDMIAGRWAFNMEPIIVAKTGELNDGQHRLQAIIASNEPRKMFIAFGAERETRTTIDQGMARTAGHYLAMQGITSSNLTAGIARMVMAYESNGGKDYRDRSHTHAEIVARALTDKGITEATDFANHVRKYAKGMLTPSQIGGCYYLFAEINPMDAKEYLTQVCLGESIKRGDPAFAVRQALSNVEGEKRIGRVELVCRGWNAFRQGRKLSVAKSLGTIPALV